MRCEEGSQNTANIAEEDDIFTDAEIRSDAHFSRFTFFLDIYSIGKPIWIVNLPLFLAE